MNGKYRTMGPHVAKWIEENCRYTTGRWTGKEVRLMPWQRKWLSRAFEIEPQTGLRKVRWCLLGLPKKSGKTEMCAWLALYFLLGDGEMSPLVACAAASDEQANLVFGAAKRCAELSPRISQLVKCYDKEIFCPSNQGRLRRLSATAGTNDGPSWSALVLDELHEWRGAKGETLWNVLTNGTGARKQPMILQITTAGWDQNSICYREYEHGKKVATGEIDDPAYFFQWEKAPKDCDYRDPEMWKLANPSYGIITEPTFFEDQLKRKTENVFRRYFLNQWTSSVEAWLPFGAWDLLTDKRAIPDRAQVVLGFDGSFSQDSTALVAVEITQPPHIVVADAWERPALADDEWKVPILEVEQAIRNACLNWSVQEIVCDPHRWARTYEILEGEGLPVVMFPQTPARMTPATARFYEAVVNTQLTHDGDLRLTRHIANCVLRTDARGARLTKEYKLTRKKIDLAVAAVMAFERASILAMQPDYDIMESVAF